MKLSSSIFIGVTAMLLALPATLSANTPAQIIPKPASYVVKEGAYALSPSIGVGGQYADLALKYLKMRGHDATIDVSAPALTVNLDAELGPEAYKLVVNPEGININAADEAGVMYAIETLTQMIDQAEDGMIAVCTIEDSPRMQYRGLMLDVVRCYMPIDEVKKFVDMAARLKLNKLHMHLTDDNGWRMEIKQYPKLTEVGAWRVDRKELFPARQNPQPGEPTTYGGFYTQDELRDLVAYAAERNIEVIPEIEMPAHAMGALASYPELTCPINQDEFIGVLTGIGGDRASVIMCAGNDNTIQFVKNVLDEVMDVFPSEYIHLGGDEANKSRWEKCPLCNQRVHDLGLHDMEELQGWFMDNINAYVRSKGKTAIGWDEVTYGKPKEDIIIMGWQGTGAVAERYAAETGRRFIMTPARSTYLIRYQGPQWFEPFTYFGNITLKDAYEFEPVKETWTEGMRDQLWGIQGSMWTEFCRTPKDVQYMVFPRMIALADVAWRPEGQRDWDGFISALDQFLPRFDEADVTYAKSMYNVQHTITPNGDGTVSVDLQCIRPDTEIWVSESEDMSDAWKYDKPFEVKASKKLYAQAHTATDVKGEVLPLAISTNKAMGKKVECDTCTNGYGQVLVNGLRGSLRNSDFEWAGWHNRQARFTVDLGSMQPISSVILGVLANANMMAVVPSRIQLYLADESQDFRLVSAIETPPSKFFSLDPKVMNIDFGPIDQQARYVKVIADNPGRIPSGYPRENSATWLYFDEIIIE